MKGGEDTETKERLQELRDELTTTSQGVIDYPKGPCDYFEERDINTGWCKRYREEVDKFSRCRSCIGGEPKVSMSMRTLSDEVRLQGKLENIIETL